MKTFTLSTQTVQNLQKLCRIPSDLELMFKNVFITTLPVFFAIRLSVVVWGLSARICVIYFLQFLILLCICVFC